MQLGEEHGKRVEELLPSWTEAAAGKQLTVRERIVDVTRDQAGAPLPGRVLEGTNDQADRTHRRAVDIAQPAQRLMVALRGLQRQLLDRIGPLLKRDEPHRVAGDPAGQVDQRRCGPVGDRSGPVELDEARVPRPERDRVRLDRGGNRPVAHQTIVAGMIARKLTTLTPRLAVGRLVARLRSPRSPEQGRAQSSEVGYLLLATTRWEAGSDSAGFPRASHPSQAAEQPLTAGE